MAIYTTTPNPEEILRSEVKEDLLDLQGLVLRYQDLETRFKAVPKLKTAPDQETLDYFNNAVFLERKSLLADLLKEADLLYQDLRSIYQAGILPVKYLDEYLKLENFVLNANN